jgi:hypothetical protein
MHKPRPVQGIAAAEALAALGYTAPQQTGQTHVGALSMTEPRIPGCQCQWEAGDSPCPVHDEDPHTKTLALHSFTGAELAALIARDADVRALDQADPQWGMAREEPRSYCVLRINGETVTHGAAFPDEARAKAAAWVREQGRPSRDELIDNAAREGNQ